MLYRDKTVRDLSQTELQHVIRTLVEEVDASDILQNQDNEVRILDVEEFANALTVSTPSRNNAISASLDVTHLALYLSVCVSSVVDVNSRCDVRRPACRLSLSL